MPQICSGITRLLRSRLLRLVSPAKLLSARSPTMGLSVASLVVWLLCLVQMTQADENGIIGFGISLYQDLCCQACHDSLSMLYLNCTTFSDGMGGDGMSGTGTDTTTMGMTSDECHASNTPWLQTMAYCIQQNCNADGYGAENQARCFSNQAVAGATSPTFQESLPATAPTEELAADAMWLNVTSLVNRDTYYATHGTLGEFARQEYMHARFSYVILYSHVSLGPVPPPPVYFRVLQSG